MRHLQLWESIESYKYGDDQYGIISYLGREPTAIELERLFEGTRATVWGNILNGRGASGTYGEIIARIRRFGFDGARDPYGVWNDCGAKNKSFA
jgi:hypothetical protein